MTVIADLDDLSDMIRRRAPIMLAVFIFGLAAALYLSSNIRAVYRAEEVLQISPARIAPEAAGALRTTPIAQLLPVLRDRVLSRQVLSEIALAYDLFQDDPNRTPFFRSELLRRSVFIDWKTSESGPGRITIAAQMTDPSTARLVAQELSHRLAETGALMRMEEAAATLNYFDREVTRLEKDLAHRKGAWDNTADAPTIDQVEKLSQLQAQLLRAETKRRKSRIGLELETRRQLERLDVVEPAQQPQQAYFDPRGALWMACCLGSALLAFMVAIITESMNPVIRTAKQMRRVTRVEPVIAVPVAGKAGFSFPLAIRRYRS